MLPDVLVVENRPGIAECRLTLGTVIRDILHHTERTPCQRQRYANTQQQNNRDFHGRTQQNS
jgi:hypothetical protein